MNYQITEVTADNYHLFDDMVYWRIHGKEREHKTTDAVNPAIIKELNNENLYVYAIETDAKYVGWISLIYLPKVGKYNGRGHIYIDELWIEPSYRRLGLAKLLLKQADKLAECKNASGIRLYVNPDNTSAMDLYKNDGFHPSSSALLMEK
ncbi:GNAT family N-acetyltransferase [Paenibacillus marinisediminis]